MSTDPATTLAALDLPLPSADPATWTIADQPLTSEQLAAVSAAMSEDRAAAVGLLRAATDVVDSVRAEAEALEVVFSLGAEAGYDLPGLLRALPPDLRARVEAFHARAQALAPTVDAYRARERRREDEED